MSKKVEEEVKPILMMGGNIPEEQLAEFRKQWLEHCKNPSMQVIHLEKPEIISIIDNRKGLKQGEAVKEFLANKQEQENAHGFANKLIDEMEKHNKEYENENNFPQRRRWKDLTNLSWKRFNTVIDTLELFGHIQWLDKETEPEYFRIVLQKEMIDRNHMETINRKITELTQQIDLAKTVINDTEAKKKLTALKRKLSLKL